MSYFTIAQEAKKQKEVGLVFNDFNNFGLTYKFGIEKSMWRLNTLFMSGSDSKEESDENELKVSSIGFGVGFGKEFRKGITEKLEMRYGADISFSGVMDIFNGFS